MAELYAVRDRRDSGERMPPAPSPAPRRGGPAPIWRSLLGPIGGHRALVIGEAATDLIHLLEESGVEIAYSPSLANDLPAPPFELVLEQWRKGDHFRPDPPDPGLLAPGGRWIVVIHGGKWVGPRSRSTQRRLRRGGLGKIETFYVHPSLWAPQILVPLQRPEPFDYFLRLAVGVRDLRRRLLVGVIRMLRRVGLHRDFLPNLIVVARRES